MVIYTGGLVRVRKIVSIGFRILGFKLSTEYGIKHGINEMTYMGSLIGYSEIYKYIQIYGSRVGILQVKKNGSSLEYSYRYSDGFKHFFYEGSELVFQLDPLKYINMSELKVETIL